MLDFTKAQKKILNIKLIDGNTLMVRMPTKRVFDLLSSLEDNLRNLQLNNKEQIDEVYSLTAEVLSNNLQGRKVDKEYLGEILDVEDITILFASYIDFVHGRVKDPNLNSPQSPEKMEG